MNAQTRTGDASFAMPGAHDDELDIGPTDTGGIDILIDHLLGGGKRVLPRAGLARLNPARLSRIQQGAEVQMDECIHSLQALSHVLGVALSHPQANLPLEVLHGMAWHVHSQSKALACWKELAEDAAYFRDHRDAAANAARRFARWARSVDEWPEPG